MSTMKRWELTDFGRANLRIAEAPVPVPGHGEVLVRIAAVALNYRDLLIVRDGMGMPVRPPLVPCSDMSGQVAAVGPGVAAFAPGDNVISTFFTRWFDGIQPAESLPLGVPGPGMLSQFVILGEDALVHAPRTLESIGASTLTCSGLTAWYALAEAASTRPGDAVVIMGTGGVALFAVQIANAQGARAIVVSGSDEKLDRVGKIGAIHGINRNRTPDWAAAVRAATAGRGADHVLDLAGGDNFGRALSAVTKAGRVSVIGNLAGDQLASPVYALLGSGATVQGIGVAPRRVLQDFVRAVDWLQLKPVVDRVYDFAELQMALDHLERGAFGKVVLRVS